VSLAAQPKSNVVLAPIEGRRLTPARPAAASSRFASAPGGMPASPSQESNSATGRLPCFVTGPENQLLAAVVSRLVAALKTPAASQPIDLPSPIVLSGPSGTGKTHLARGLVELWNAKQSADEATYLTASDFARRFADAIDRGEVREFRRRLRRQRLLVIDDVHRLGETSTRRAALRRTELQQTIDAVQARGGLLLLTLQGALADHNAFDRPLVSRLAAGLVIEIVPPGCEARRELLRQAAQVVGCRLDDQALETLAQQLPNEPPRLLRAAIELRRRAGARIDVQSAQRLLEADQPRQSPPLGDILRIVARYHKIPLKVLTSASRRKGVVAARAVAIYLARELTPMSYADIGQLLGGRDHTTIMHSHRRLRDQLPGDRALASSVEELRRLLAP